MLVWYKISDTTCTYAPNVVLQLLNIAEQHCYNLLASFISTLWHCCQHVESNVDIGKMERGTNITTWMCLLGFFFVFFFFLYKWQTLHYSLWRSDIYQSNFGLVTITFIFFKGVIMKSRMLKLRSVFCCFPPYRICFACTCFNAKVSC